jgi:hypothetical protein
VISSLVMEGAVDVAVAVAATDNDEDDSHEHEIKGDSRSPVEPQQGTSASAQQHLVRTGEQLSVV